MNEPSNTSQFLSARVLRQILFLCGSLIAYQLIRAIIYWGSQLALPADIPFLDELLTLITFGGLSLVWLLIVRPSVTQLGLSLGGMRRKDWVILSGMVALLIFLFITSAFIDPRMLVANLANALIVPIAEELIFRGWLWNKLEAVFSGRRQQLLTWFVTTALFALWHLGYIDVVSQHISQMNIQQTPLAWIMSMKVVVGAAIGGLAGLARWKSRRIYAAVFVHAIWNIFGR